MAKKVFQLEYLKSKNLVKKVNFTFLILVVIALISVATILVVFNFIKTFIVLVLFNILTLFIFLYHYKAEPLNVAIIDQNRLIEEIVITRPKFKKIREEVLNCNEVYINIDNKEHYVTEFWDFNIVIPNFKNRRKIHLKKLSSIHYNLTTYPDLIINTGGDFKYKEIIPAKFNLKK